MTPDERDLVSGVRSRGEPSDDDEAHYPEDDSGHLPVRYQEASMLAVCINCWRELQSESGRCPQCGEIVDFNSPSYERLLFWALRNSQPEHRAEVCKILGIRAHKKAVSHLIEAVNDHSTIVRIAALGALGAIADESAIPVIEKVLGSESLEVQGAARRALHEIEASHKVPTSSHRAEAHTPKTAHRAR